MADVKYVVTVDATGAVKEIQTLDKAWEKVQKDTGPKTTGVMGELGKAVSSVAGQFTIATLAARAIEGTISGIKNFFSSAIQGAIEEESSQFRLKTALELTGRARFGGMRDLKNFAQEQSRATVYTHEEIEATETLLAQMTKLDNEGIKNMTKGVMGLASVLGPGEGLEGATMRVMRAIEGNAAGLKKVGIEIDTTLPKGEQLIQIQKQLAELYPRATAELETTEGSIKNLKKEWDELKEEMGASILEALNAGGNFQKLTAHLRAMRDANMETAEAVNYHNVKIAESRAAYDKQMLGPMPMEKVLATLKRDLPEIQTSYKVLMDVYLQGEAAFNKYIETLIAVNDIIEKNKRATEGALKPTDTLGQALKDLGIKGAGELKTQLDLAKKTLDDYMKTSDPAAGVVEALRKKVSELTLALYGPPDPLKNIGKHITALKPVLKSGEEMFEEFKKEMLDSLTMELPEINFDEIFKPPTTEEVPEFIRNLIGDIEKTGHVAAINKGKLDAMFEVPTTTQLESQLVALKRRLDEMTKSGGHTEKQLDDMRRAIKGVENELRDTPKWIYQLQAAIEAVAPVVNAAFTGMGNIFSQVQQNKEIAIENEYKKRLDYINRTVKDEEEKQKAIMALEAEFEIKRTSARAAAAKQAKALAIAQAIWNTAQGVTAALAELNFVLAAVVAALGAVQIATIAKQPIPLARGAVFRREMLMATSEGQTFKVGEEGPEYLIPEKHLRAPGAGPSGFVGLRAPTGRTGGGAVIHINIRSPLVQTQGLSNADLMAAGDELFRIIERQARRRGRW